MVMNLAFKNQMFKASKRKRVNMGRMTSKDMRSEYTKQSKVANKRIRAIEKAGYYSPALENLKRNGVKSFGLKNQGLVSDSDIKKAYRDLMDFLDSTTSSKSGIRTTIDKMVQNFNMTFNGNYAQFSKKSKKIFDLYEDLAELSKNGDLSSNDKYDIISDLNTLYESGYIDDNTTPADLIDMLNDMYDERNNQAKLNQSKLKFNWTV